MSKIIVEANCAGDMEVIVSIATNGGYETIAVQNGEKRELEVSGDKMISITERLKYD